MNPVGNERVDCIGLRTFDICWPRERKSVDNVVYPLGQFVEKSAHRSPPPLHATIIIIIKLYTHQKNANGFPSMKDTSHTGHQPTNHHFFTSSSPLHFTTIFYLLTTYTIYTYRYCERERRVINPAVFVRFTKKKSSQFLFQQYFDTTHTHTHIAAQRTVRVCGVLFSIRWCRHHCTNKKKYPSR